MNEYTHTEKRLRAVSIRPLTADGTVSGLATIDNACDFKVKQEILLTATGLPTLILEVKRVVSDTELWLGPIKQPIHVYSDISAYTVAVNAQIEAKEQFRPNVPEQEIERITYEEEPTIARRVVLVDKCGRKYTLDNPLPVNASFTVGDIQIESDAMDGDNIAISAHPDPIFDDAPDTITTDGWEEIYSYTSINDDTRIVCLHVAVSTPSNLQVKIDGDIIREHRTSPTERNAEIMFREHRPLSSGAVITVEAKVDRKIWPSYTTFTALEGYIA